MIIVDQVKKNPVLLLMLTTVLAMIISNTPMKDLYESILATKVGVDVVIGSQVIPIKKSLLMWINEGLMAIFFFAVTLEVKHEMLFGVINTRKKILLPLMGAAGGMLVPVIIYLFFNYGNDVRFNGWAIPVATDIAFAVGLISYFKDSIPLSIRALLLSIAVLDDIGSILIIALYYTDNINAAMLEISFVMVSVLFLMNYLGINRKILYVVIAVINWYFLVYSGVHATLSGVVLALAMPIKLHSTHAILKKLNTFIYFIILPFFALCNAGISFSVDFSQMILNPVSLGIILGLFVGKPLGIISSIWCAVRLGVCSLPNNITVLDLVPMGFVCGIGFTMSLFFGTLAFDESPHYLDFVKVGVLCGSTLSGVTGFYLLYKSKVTGDLHDG